LLLVGPLAAHGKVVAAVQAACYLVQARSPVGQHTRFPSVAVVLPLLIVLVTTALIHPHLELLQLVVAVVDMATALLVKMVALVVAVVDITTLLRRLVMAYPDKETAADMVQTLTKAVPLAAAVAVVVYMLVKVVLTMVEAMVALVQRLLSQVRQFSMLAAAAVVITSLALVD
jgi:hypothetical protein